MKQMGEVRLWYESRYYKKYIVAVRNKLYIIYNDYVFTNILIERLK